MPGLAGFAAYRGHLDAQPKEWRPLDACCGRRVHFCLSDIRRDMPREPFDLALCPNLAFTYVDDAGQNMVLSGILEALWHDGWLPIGTHERLPEVHPLCADSPQLGFYRKQRQPRRA